MLTDKLNSLVDALGRPLHDLRISVTDRCNFNCTYCMPDKDITFLPKQELLSFEEIIRIVKILVSFGVKKVKLTGGEPTLRAGLDKLIKMLNQIPEIEDIGLTTNGTFLKKLGKRLFDAGLRRVSISLDALDEQVFQSICGGTHSLHPILSGIEYAKKIGFSPIKINCVIQKHVNKNQVLPMVEYFKNKNIAIRFIELMDVGSVVWDKKEVLSSKELLNLIQSRYELEKISPAYRGEVASKYKHVNSSAEIGFISSVSQPFCKDCNRLRLTAEGSLYGCLFATKSKNIKQLLRSTADDTLLASELKKFWQLREDRYSELRSSNRQEKINKQKQNMNFIGG